MLATLLALTSLIPAIAGNIPQYTVSKDGAVYSEMTDGTSIPCSWTTGTYALLPDGTVTPNSVTDEGYPIGFDFRFAGTTVDRFLPDNIGNIYLGKDAVAYLGSMRVSMSPMNNGLKAGQISYKTAGDEGNRILYIQWKNATINTTGGYVGKYNLQFRFYEADGKIEMAFKELVTPDRSNGFDTSLRGMDTRDVLLITATGLNKDISVSPKYAANILEPDSYVKWDCDYYDNGYAPTFVFTPASDTTAPISSPTDLKAIQTDDYLTITCTRGTDADATVLLISEVPYTDTDMPVDGESFQASYLDKRGKQIFPTTFGNAKALLYNNDQDISVSYLGVEDGKTYYIRALSANGYPVFNRTDVADIQVKASQAPPKDLILVSSDATTIHGECLADDNVIIAVTNEVKSGYKPGYVGTFGIPEADCATGDEISGGGKVIYVGAPGTFSYDCAPNEVSYVRAWTVKDGLVSSTAIDSYVIPKISFPYAPSIENYPCYEVIEGWTATSNQFLPTLRDYELDPAVVALTTLNQEVTLTTPALNVDGPVKVTFEFAMETDKGTGSTSDSGGVALPQGTKPGEFGDNGYLKVRTGDTDLKTVNSYSGTMVTFNGSDMYKGSSTFEEVSVDIPELGSDKTITFAFSVTELSYLYLRNIVVEQIDDTPELPTQAPTELSVKENDGLLTVTCKRGEDAEYTAVLVSESPFTDEDLPQDGTLVYYGNKVGNARVIYCGTDEEIECKTDLRFFNPGYETDCYLVALSANSTPAYNRQNMAALTYRTLPEDVTSGINAVESESMDFSSVEIYNMQGIRLKASSLKALPSGIYIVNGKKTTVRR